MKLNQIILKTNKIPSILTVQSSTKPSARLAQCIDAGLMAQGFKLSFEALSYISQGNPEEVGKLAEEIISAVEVICGSHVRHNVYFKSFPKNIPNTAGFWFECLVDFLKNCGYEDSDQLPLYGNYHHTYEEMLALHETYLPSLSDKYKLIGVGGSLEQEKQNIFMNLCASKVPLNAEDKSILGELTLEFADICEKTNIRMRENRAIVNSILIPAGFAPVQIDTVTDVLRLACALSTNGDPSLAKDTVFPSFSKSTRRMLLGLLENIVSENDNKLCDVLSHKEQWKRLAEKLHPGEFQKRFPNGAKVFEVAYGKHPEVKTFNSKVETAYKAKNQEVLLEVLRTSPGGFVRGLDRFIRSFEMDGTERLIEALRDVLPRVSGRVILSVLEYFQNRELGTTSRMFLNKNGNSWIEKTPLAPLGNQKILGKVIEILNEELQKRVDNLAQKESLVYSGELDSVTLPLSEKNKSKGLGVLPRGSLTTVNDSIIRMFLYWHQTSTRTDYDLSALVLNKDFKPISQCSYTRLNSQGMTHSGDIVNAPNGASEFIDIELSALPEDSAYVLMQINAFAGESFDSAKEVFCGYMERNNLNKNAAPFEPKSARCKSELVGKNGQYMPMMFVKQADGTWKTLWLQIYAKGRESLNTVTGNINVTKETIKNIVNHKYVYIGDLYKKYNKNTSKVLHENNDISYVSLNGLEKECFHYGRNFTITKNYGLSSLSSLIPE